MHLETSKNPIDCRQQWIGEESFNGFETLEYLRLQVSSILVDVALSTSIHPNWLKQSNDHGGPWTGKNIYSTLSANDDLSTDEFDGCCVKIVGWNTAAAAAPSSPTIFTNTQWPTTRRSSNTTKKTEEFSGLASGHVKVTHEYDLRGPPFAISAIYNQWCYSSV